MSYAPNDRARLYAALLDAGGSAPTDMVRVLAGLAWDDFDRAALELRESGVLELTPGASTAAIKGRDGITYVSLNIVLTKPS